MMTSHRPGSLSEYSLFKDTFVNNPVTLGTRLNPHSISIRWPPSRVMAASAAHSPSLLFMETNRMQTTTRTDIHDRVTASMIAQFEKGVRPWATPWNAEHAAGRITRPLHWDGTPYQGINVLALWLALR